MLHILLVSARQEALHLLAGGLAADKEVRLEKVGSGAVPVVELNEIFRQSRQSSIIVNAHRINNGIMPLFKAPENQLDDFYFIGKDDPEEAL